MAAFEEWALVDDNGVPVLEFTSMISAEIKQEGSVSSEPVEQGSFASYNKVGTPLDVNVQVGVQGDPSELQSFLDKLETLSKEATLFSLVTGEQEYKNLTLETYGYSRKREDGVSSLYVDMHLVEIREVSPQYANVKLPAAKCRNPENASRVDVGKVQAVEIDESLMIELGKSAERQLKEWGWRNNG